MNIRNIEKSQPNSESYPDQFAYTLGEWDEKMGPQIGEEKRFRPLKDRSDERFHYIQDTITGDVFYYTIERQQGGRLGREPGDKFAPPPVETRMISCVKEK